jgi:transcriptional regulator with XRE-family HTH domain
MTKLRQARISRGLTILELAYTLRVHPSTLSQVECKKLVPSPKVKEALCEFYGVDTSKVFRNCYLLT